jgi:hypothetical protein
MFVAKLLNPMDEVIGVSVKDIRPCRQGAAVRRKDFSLRWFNKVLHSFQVDTRPILSPIHPVQRKVQVLTATVSAPILISALLIGFSAGELHNTFVSQ